MKTLLLAVLASASLAVHAQGAGDSRGTVPPGTSADGSRPADGAITGGSILPGERSGMPDKPVLPEERVKRCNELSGSLREECLMREQSSGGGSRNPAADGTKGIKAPDAPPPQNPR